MHLHISALFTVVDTNADDAFDYQDFTEFLSRSKLWEGKDHGEFLNDQQVLWNCFDHYNIGTVLRRDFQLLGYCFLMHKSTKGALESFARHEHHQRESKASNEGQNSHSLHQESRFPTMRDRDLHTFRNLLSLLTEFAMKELQQAHTPTVPEANTTSSRRQLQHPHQQLAGSSQSIDGTNSVLTASRRSVATAESFELSFKPKIYSHSYKLAQRKERREQELVNQVVQQQQAKLLESQQQQLEKLDKQSSMEESTRGRLRLSPSRQSSRAKFCSASIRTNKPSSTQEQGINAFQPANEMNISELLSNEGNLIDAIEHVEVNVDDNNAVNAQHNHAGEEEEVANESQEQPYPSQSAKEHLVQKSHMVGESTQLTLSTSASRLADKLIARGVLIQLKKEKRAEKLKEQKQADCTFKPKIKILRLKSKTPTHALNDLLQSLPVDTLKVPKNEHSDIDEEKRRHRQRRMEGRQKCAMLASTDSAEATSPPPPLAVEVEDNNANSSTRRGSIATAMATLLLPTGTIEDKSQSRKSQNDDDLSTSSSSNSDSSTSPPPPPPSSSSSITCVPHPDAPVYERLYALKDKKPATVPLHLHPKYLQEMEGCTFQPHIERRPAKNTQHSTQEISAYEKTVSRMREIYAAKQKKKEEEENAWKEIDERYKRNRALLMKEGTKPFQFQSEKRLKEIAEKARAKAQDKTDLIVEVKLSAAKSARISVGHNENPLSAVQKFTKIYGLESDAVQILLTVVQQAMQARNDAIARAQAEAEQAEQLLREDQARIAAEIEVQEMAAAAAVRDKEALTRRQAEEVLHGGKRRKHKNRVQRVINEHGEEIYYEDAQDNVNNEDDIEDDEDDLEEDEYDNDDEQDRSHDMPSMMVLTGYDNYGNPVYAPVDPHQYHNNRPSNGSRSRAHYQAHSNHPHNHHPQYPSNNGDSSPHGNGMMHPHTLSDELDMVHVEDDYSSYTGTSSDLSDDLDDEDEEDENEDDDYDSDEDEEDEGNEEGGEKKARRMRRRSSSKRSSILSQFF